VLYFFYCSTSSSAHETTTVNSQLLTTTSPNDDAITTMTTTPLPEQTSTTAVTTKGDFLVTTTTVPEQTSAPESSSSEDYSTTIMDAITSTSTVASNTNCHWVCPKNYTEQELSDTIKKLKEELKTEKTTTSKYVRSKTSAKDDRRSSAAIGVVGIVILSVIGIGMVLLDMPNLVQLIHQIKHVMKH